MKQTEFNSLLFDIIKEIKARLNIKAADYAEDNDRLVNFKRQAKIANITPLEALRGNWVKHLASIMQGLDELKAHPKTSIRDIEDWWWEKVIDSINYHILLLALLEDQDGYKK